MAADWNEPTNSTTTINVLSILNEKVQNAAKMSYGSDTNLPTGTIRYNTTTKAFQSWNGSAWSNMVVAAAVGSAGSPGLVFSGDTTTGFWSPSSGIIAASLSGTEKFRMNSTGFGFGGAPTSYVHAYKAGSIDCHLECTATNGAWFRATSNSASLYFGKENSAGNVFSCGSDANFIMGTGGHDLAIGTNGAQRWRITSTGVLANKTAGNESTGAGSAALGSNCPAVTASAPYTWLKIETSDGSTGYIPVWK